MNDSNKYPNIKPVKLEEEKNNKNENSIQQNKEQKEKINNIKKKCLNESIKNSFCCFTYFIFYSFIIFLFVFNYYLTKNAFDENKNIIIPADKLCKNTTNNLAKCLKHKEKAKNCITENKILEYCYEDANIFNQKCGVFISELELGYRKNKSADSKYKDIKNDLILCGKNFRFFSLKDFNLKDLL